MFRMVGGSLGIAITGAIFQALVSSQLGTLLSGSGISSTQRGNIADQLGSGSVSGALNGLDPTQAKQATTAGGEAFVYGLSNAMTVSAVVALAGAAIGVLAIRAKTRGPTTVEAAEAVANPGGSAVAVQEAQALAASEGREVATATETVA
jgi:hypothetical protein